MLVRIAKFEVKPDALEAFKAATLRHADTSRLEDGVGRFEFYKGEEPNRFVLFIQFESEEARARHFETHHIKEWRSQVLPMLTKPIDVSTYFPVEVK